MDDAQIDLRRKVQVMADGLGLSVGQFAKKAGLAPSTLNRFDKKDVKHLLSTRTMTTLTNYWRTQGSPGGDSIEDDLPSGLNRPVVNLPDDPVAARIYALRVMFWENFGGAAAAASALRLLPEELAIIEKGQRPPSAEVVLRLAEETACPVSFILHGRTEELRPNLAGQLALRAPSLVPALLDPVEPTGRPGSEA